jgi:hypothetical protein
MGLSRQGVRYLGAAAAALMAGIYFLIGVGVLDIGGTTSGETPDQFGFGFSAGSAFLLTAVLLLLTDRRWIWILAAVFQVLVLVIYIGASAVREPPFEIWGITLRVIQLPLLLAVGWLALDSDPRRSVGPRQVLRPR